MAYVKPIPVKKENIIIGNKYYSCSYSGVIVITVIKRFDDTNCVLVKTKNNKCKPFIRNIEYIFDNQDMARSAGRNWEHDQRKRKKNK